MAISDYRSEQEQNAFDIQQQARQRQRSFGFQTGLGTTAPVGSLPTGRRAGRMGPRQGPNLAGAPNYGLNQPTSYGAGQSTGRQTQPNYGGTGSISQAWGGTDANAQQAITAPANSRALSRGINQTADSFNTIRNINVDFGSENIGTVSTGGGDILGTGAQQDKRTQSVVQQNVSGRASANFGPTSVNAPKGKGGATGATSVASGNKVNVQKGKVNSVSQSPNQSQTTTNITNNNAPKETAEEAVTPVQTPGKAPSTKAKKSGAPKKSAPAKETTMPAETPAGTQAEVTESPVAKAVAEKAAPKKPAAKKPEAKTTAEAPKKEAPKPEAKAEAPAKKVTSKSGKPKAQAPAKAETPQTPATPALEQKMMLNAEGISERHVKQGDQWVPLSKLKK